MPGDMLFALPSVSQAATSALSSIASVSDERNVAVILMEGGIASSIGGW